MTKRVRDFVRFLILARTGRLRPPAALARAFSAARPGILKLSPAPDDLSFISTKPSFRWRSFALNIGRTRRGCKAWSTEW